MKNDSTAASFDDAIATFNRGAYFEAAEMFETAAHSADDDLKGLIVAFNQISAAFHLRFERGGRQASINLMSQAMIALDDMKPARGGVDVRAAVRRAGSLHRRGARDPARRARRPQASRPNFPRTPPRPEDQPRLNVMNITHEQISDGLKRAKYVTNERVETAIFLALALEKPLLIEGPAGAGKTEVAKVLAEILHTELIRLQCYEGLDEARALYEWNYQKQLLRMQADEQQGLRWEELSEHIFSRDFLLERPLLRAITSPGRVVLLIDEVDKADEEFEAFLLELLSDFQVSVPELGTLKAHERPAVILTSNRARELSEALRRRCLHLFIDFPGTEQERKIIELKVPELDAKLAAEAARFVGAIRKLGLRKPPSIAETLDWARALVRLGVRELDTDAVRTALGVLLKHEDDRAKVESKASTLAPHKR